MTVGLILKDKGTDVYTTTKDTQVIAVAKTLAIHKIGAIVVLDGEKICGIVSERDVVREIAQDGDASLTMPVSSCMTKKVISCARSDTIAQVMELMTTGKFRHMPVEEDGKLVGIISIGDVVKRKIQAAEQEAAEMRNYISAS